MLARDWLPARAGSGSSSFAAGNHQSGHWGAKPPTWRRHPQSQSLADGTISTLTCPKTYEYTEIMAVKPIVGVRSVPPSRFEVAQLAPPSKGEM